MRNLVREKLLLLWLTYRNCSPISKSIVSSSSCFSDICWSSFCCVLFFGKFWYFLSYIWTLFLFNFFCNFGFFKLRSSLQLWRASLAVSFYPLVTIILEAAIMRYSIHFAKLCSRIQNKSFLVAAFSVNSSICVAAIGSILIYFCTAYNWVIIFTSINSLNFFIENWVLDNTWVTIIIFLQHNKYVK